MKYRKVKLKDIATVIMGQSPKGSSYNNEKIGIPFLQGNRTFGRLYPTIDTWTAEPNKIGRRNSILMSVRAPVGDLNIANENICIGRGLCSIEMLNGNNQFLYYLLKNSISEIKIKSTGTIFDSINRTELENIEVLDFNEKQQNKVVNILFSIDKKIELNNQINDNLLEIGKQIYKEKAREESNRVELKMFFEVKTGKKDANASVENGMYPFFTCSKQMLKIDDYSFDGPAILVAGNGDFNVKVFYGRFDAYQRTYVLMPNNEQYLGYLYFAISENLNNLTAGFRGSVIKFITKGMIENYTIPYIRDEKTYKCFNKIVEKIQSNNDEIEELIKIRDTLLPKLMNGKIDLDKIEI